MIAGLQPTLSLPSGSILGRSSAKVGSVETISLGANLTLMGGTLTAASSPFVVSQLPVGITPSGSELIPFLQSGSNVAVSYTQFLGGISGIPNLNVSQAVVQPTGSNTVQKLADFASGVLSFAGGSLTGPLSLAGSPTSGRQAATKDYADLIGAAALPKSGGSLSGPLTLSADPVISNHAATKNYVDGQLAVALPRAGGTVSGPLTLALDPTLNLQAATKQYSRH